MAQIINGESVELVAVGALTAHPQNPNRGDVTAIAESIAANGFYGALIVQRSTGYVLAGNHRLEAARRIGLAEVPTIFVDVDDRRALKILLADNRTSELASRDAGELAQLLDELAADDDLLGTGYGEDELSALLDELEPAPERHGEEGADDRIAAASALQQKWKTAPGQVWRAGRHRIGCGSSIDEEFVRRVCEERVDLVLSDPPYGINVVPSSGRLGGGGNKYAKVLNDESTDVALAFIALYERLWAPDAIIWGGNYFTDVLPPSRGWIVWDKDNEGMSFADVELAWTSFDRSARRYLWTWNGWTRQADSDVDRGKRAHPTQKPVGLHEIILAEWGRDADVVLDGFLGSGTTALACERTGHTCYGIELSPEYVAVTLERLSELGVEAELI